MEERISDKLQMAGSTLGPLFLHDPLLEAQAVGELYRILAQSDPAALAAEWPFVEADQALVPLQAMVSEAAAHCAAEDAGDALPDDLTWEYRRLFVGPAHKAAPPWGSVYTDKDQVIFGASTLELREWLRRQGIAIDRGPGDEPEDHIGTMLVLLAWLADENPQAVDEYLTDHLLPWAPHFLGYMEEQSEHPFFRALAQLTRLTLEGARDEMGLQVRTPRFYR